MTAATEEPRPAPAGAPSRRLPRPGVRARTVALFAAGVLAAFLAVAVDGALFPGPAPLSTRDVQQAITSALASQTPGPALSQQAYAAIAPALVVVQAQLAAPSAGSDATLGSGVIVDTSGDILTALHVVQGAGTIAITFADGTQTTATIATQTADSDTAVLHPAQLPAQFTPAVLGDPAAVRVGSEAYVVGNPFGLTGSISAGVVSGLDRSFQMPDGGPTLHGLIQVDAAVNPGASGGALVDRNGRLIGIVTALVNPTRQDVFIGIGLAVPIDVAGGAAGLPQY